MDATEPSKARGVLLAVSSNLCIGASFVVKKRGCGWQGRRTCARLRGRPLLPPPAAVVGGPGHNDGGRGGQLLGVRVRAVVTPLGALSKMTGRGLLNRLFTSVGGPHF